MAALQAVQADVTTLPVDAIVNAAVRRAVGPELLASCCRRAIEAARRRAQPGFPVHQHRWPRLPRRVGGAAAQA